VEPSRRIAGRGRRAGDHATGGRVAPAAVERSGRPSAGSPSSRRVASVMLCRMPARPSSARPRRRDSVWWRRSAGTRSSSWAAGAHPAPRHRRARRDAAPGSDAGHRLLETRMALRRDRRRWPRARGRCDADRGGARRPEPVPLPDRGRRLRQWRHVGGHVPGGGDRLLVYDHRELRCGGAAGRGRAVPDRRSPSPAAAPDLGRRPRGGDSSVLVLARGRTADALRLLDEYDARDCRDRRTLLLPRKSSALAYADGIFYIEYEDPAPQILALRPVFE